MTTTLIHNGTIWPGAGQPVVESMLIVDGLVHELSPTPRSLHCSPETSCDLDLQGGFVMPSFGDGHAHPIFGGLEQQGPRIRAARSVEQVVDAVARYARAHPGEGWIVGSSYDSSIVDGGMFDARWLDEAIADRPIALRANDYHTMWCNTAALRQAGITESTPQPALGHIVRRADGSAMALCASGAQSTWWSE